MNVMSAAQVRPNGRASDYVFELVVEDVVSGKLTPGSRVTEGMLVERSGLGRGPVREALNRLEERGLVLREPNFSCRIAAFTERDILDMIQIRGVLEGLAARLAAQHATTEQIGGLRQHLEWRAADLAQHSASPGTSIDLGFHDRVAIASGNAKLIKILCQDFYSTLRIWRRQQTNIELNTSEDALVHAKILNAIAGRDPEIAELLMRRHIEKVHEHYATAFGNALAQQRAR